MTDIVFLVEFAKQTDVATKHGYARWSKVTYGMHWKKAKACCKKGVTFDGDGRITHLTPCGLKIQGTESFSTQKTHAHRPFTTIVDHCTRPKEQQ